MYRLIATLLCLLPLATSGTTSVNHWSDALRMDAQALHDDLAANHPGAVDPLNPAFAANNDRQLALALDRARRTHDFAGYVFAMRMYTASFDDGHLGILLADDARLPRLSASWPGFLTAFDANDVQHVVTRADDAPVPLGARLLSCDGVPASRLAADRVGALFGRWSLRSQRVWRGGRLFVDEGNPWIPRPSRCDFETGGHTVTVTLAWRPLDAAELGRRLDDAYRRRRDPIGLRSFPDGTVWITLSDFDSTPGGPAAKALEPLIARLDAERARIVAAPRIVLDLRGNNGGSSDWSRQIAEAIWGKKAVAATDKPVVVDWRASTANIAFMQGYIDKIDQTPGASTNMVGWFRQIVDGMSEAMREGKPYWRTPPDADDKASYPDVPAPGARIYMVTDSGCASACLDAADVWLALGAIHVGQETSADTLYMDIRQTPLPSGMTRLGAAMKVYRGRTRGNNVPLVPARPYGGDLTDTTALEHWIAALPSGR